MEKTRTYIFKERNQSYKIKQREENPAVNKPGGISHGRHDQGVVLESGLKRQSRIEKDASYCHKNKGCNSIYIEKTLHGPSISFTQLANTTGGSFFECQFFII